MTETRTGENAPLIQAIERLASEKHNRARPEMIELQHGDKRLVWRDASGELLREDFKASPARRRGTIEVQSVDGLAEAIARLERLPTGARDSDADRFGRHVLLFFRGDRVVAELNLGREGVPDYGDHSIAFRPRVSPEWQRWRSFAGGPQKQRKAVEFVEDNAADFAEPLPGTVGHATLVSWLERLSLKVLREMEQSDTDVADRTTATGSATATLVTRLALRVYEDGPVLGFRVRWRAGLGEDDRLQVSATIVNADEAERRVWLGPVPEGAEWRPLVEAVAEAVGLPVIV